MKKIVLLVLVLITARVFGQLPTGHIKINMRYDFVGVAADSNMTVPRYGGTPSGVRNGWYGAGQIGVDTTNHRFYFYSGGSWRRVANYSEVVTAETDPLSWHLTGTSTLTGNTVIAFNSKKLYLQNGTDYLLKLDPVTAEYKFGNTGTGDYIAIDALGSKEYRLVLDGTLAQFANNSYVNFPLPVGIGTAPSNPLEVAGSTSTTTARISNSSNGTGLEVSTASGYGINISSSTGPGAQITSTSNLPITIVANPVSSNSVVPVSGYIRNTSGTASNGIGVSEEWYVESSNGNNRLASSWEYSFTDATDASRTAKAELKLVNSATTRTILSISGAGQTTLGVAGTQGGYLSLTGSTSGTVSIKTQAAAGTYNFNLPTSAGNSNDILISGGGGTFPMQWATSASIRAVPVVTDIDLTAGSYTIAQAGIFQIKSGDATNTLDFPDPNAFVGERITILGTNNNATNTKLGGSYIPTNAAGSAFTNLLVGYSYEFVAQNSSNPGTYWMCVSRYNGTVD